jgi:hypothetical protein
MKSVYLPCPQDASSNIPTPLTDHSATQVDERFTLRRLHWTQNVASRRQMQGTRYLRQMIPSIAVSGENICHAKRGSLLTYT